ncbi:MAG: transposase [Salinibacter sp.]
MTQPLKCSAGRTTTDTGGLLIREVAEKMSFVGKAVGCFADCRDPERREHEVSQLLAQRIMGLALGYEDLDDKDALWGAVAAGEPGLRADRAAPEMGTARNRVGAHSDLDISLEASEDRSVGENGGASGLL